MRELNVTHTKVELLLDLFTGSDMMQRLPTWYDISEARAEQPGLVA